MVASVYIPVSGRQEISTHFVLLALFISSHGIITSDLNPLKNVVKTCVFIAS